MEVQTLFFGSTWLDALDGWYFVIDHTLYILDVKQTRSVLQPEVPATSGQRRWMRHPFSRSDPSALIDIQKVGMRERCSYFAMSVVNPRSCDIRSKSLRNTKVDLHLALRIYCSTGLASDQDNAGAAKTIPAKCFTCSIRPENPGTQRVSNSAHHYRPSRFN